MAAVTQETFLEKLKAALGLVESLKAENESYKDNFDEMTNNYTQLENKFDKLSKEFVIVCREKEIIQADFDGAKEGNKLKLAEKEKALDEIRKRPPTKKEVELIKLELQQDLEKSSQAKFEMIDKECAKYRSLYYKVRREWDASQTEGEMKVADLERKMSEATRAHEEEISLLESKMAVMQQSLEETSQVERLRSVQRERQELELRVKALLQEIEEVRADKERIRLLAEQEDRSHKRQLADHISASKGFYSEKESLQAKCNIIEEENRLSERKKGELLEENNRLKKELDKTISAMEENAHKYSMDLGNSQMSLLKSRNEGDRNIEQYKGKLSSLHSEKKALEELISELRERISTQEKDYLDKLRLSKEEDWQKISITEAEKANSDKQLALIKQRLVDEEYKSEAVIKEQDKECQRLKGELQTLLAINDSLEQKQRQTQLDKEHSTTLLDETKDKLQNSIMAHQKDSASLAQVTQNLKVSLEQEATMEESLKTLQSQIEHLNEQAGREMEAYEHTLERQNFKFSQEKLQLNQQIEVITRDRLQYVERIEMMENVLERQQALFESKITLLKDRVRLQKTETQGIKQLLESENIRKEEGRKKQANLMHFLAQIQNPSKKQLTTV